MFVVVFDNINVGFVQCSCNKLLSLFGNRKAGMGVNIVQI